MDEASFKIDFDEQSKLLRATTLGFWSLQTVEEYATALHAAIGRIRRRGLKVGIIIDGSRMTTQSHEIGERFVAAWQLMLDQPDDRAAIVAHSALAAMQFRRIYETERCHVVASLSEAEIWLSGELTRLSQPPSDR